MTETPHNPEQRREQYRNILHYFVGEAREEAKIRTDVPAKVILVNMLADALYDSEQFPSRARHIIEKNPASKAALAYEGLLAAHRRGDFKRLRDHTEVSDVLRENPDYLEARRQANLSIRGDGDHRAARVRSYHTAEYILFVLPHEKNAEPNTQVPSQPTSQEPPQDTPQTARLGLVA